MTRFLTLLLALLIAAIGVPAHAADEPKAPTQVAFEKGLEFYEAGKFQEALAAFAEFEPGQKHSLSTLAPNAIYFGGWCLVGLKRPQDAVAKFRLVVDKFGDRPIAPEALLKLAETYRDLKQLDNALATYREFQKKFASDKLLPQAMLGEAWVLFKQGKQNGPAKNIAAKVYREYADNASARLDSLFLLGQIYTEEKNYEEARKVYEELKRLRNNPRASEALFLAAESLYSNAEKLKTAGQQDAAVKSFEDSIQYYERVLSKDSLIADVQKQIADIRTRVLRVRDPQVRTALQSRIEELQRLIASISQQNDLRPLALFRVANAYQSVDRPEEASLVYRHFLRLYGNQKELKDLSGQAQFGLIQTLNMRGQAEKAKQATDDFEKNFPEMKGKDIILYAKFLKGDSEFKTKQYKEALASFEDFLKTSKNVELNQTAEFYIAACRFALEDYDKAREAFEEFLKKYPQSPLVADAQFRLGRCHFELAKPEKAGDAKTREAQLKKAAEYYELVRSGGKKQELVPEVVFQLGYLYSFLGEFDAANYEKSATAFREYADKWPDQPLAPEALYQLAQSVNALKKYDDAIAALKRLVDKYPDDKLAPWGAFGIGAAQAAAQRPDEMAAALKAFVTKYPTHEKAGEALYSIGQSYENRGKIPEALGAYQNLVDFAANATEKADTLINPATAAQMQVANLLVRGRKFDEAVTSCLGFLKKFSDRSVPVRAIITQLSAMYRTNKMIEEGKTKFAELAAEYQQNADVRIAVTTALVDLANAAGDTQGAYSAALKLKVDPNRDRLPALSYISMGTTFLKTEHPADAKEAFETMLKAYPDDERNTPVALTGLGNALLSLNQLPEAEVQFNKVIADHSRHPAVLGAHLGLGKILEARGQFDPAVKEYEAARIPKSDTELEASFRIGLVAQLKKNDCKAALPMYARLLLASGPMAEEAAFRTAQCHRTLFLNGEKTALEIARRSYQSYLGRYKKNGRFLKEAQEELDSLPPPAPPPGG